MSNTQPEALRLAEQLRDLSTMFKTPSHEKGVCNGANQELRRLQALNAELLEALRAMLNESVCLRGDSIPSDTLARARAAIAKAEGQQ